MQESVRAPGAWPAGFAVSFLRSFVACWRALLPRVSLERTHTHMVATWGGTCCGISMGEAQSVLTALANRFASESWF